jgi:hypothetical protein
MNGVGYGITPFMGASGILARSSGGGGGAFVNEYSMTFDGINDSFDCGNVTTLDNQTNISISFWFKSPITASGPYYPISKYGTGGNQLLVTYRVNGALDVSLGGIGLFRSANNLNYSDGNWHHMMITYDSSRTNIYNRTAVRIDDVDILHSTFTQNSTSITPATSLMSIGARTGYGFYEWLGEIDEVAIWNITLSPTEITEIYNLGTPINLASYNPSNWWRMGDGDTWDGSSWTLTDNGSGGNDGTSVSMPEGARVNDVP